MSNLWEHDDVECSDHVEVPQWIEQDISPYDVAAICQGGCASGAYMPAVTHYKALETMSEYGDDVLQYIEDNYGELLQPNAVVSWSGLACFYLSIAVEMWASCVEDELSDIISGMEGEDTNDHWGDEDATTPA